MKSEIDTNLKELIVDFYEIDSGWIYFKLSLEEQTLLCRFSEVFDPILDFKKWLEAISIGVNQTSFRVNAENCFFLFNFETIFCETEKSKISNNDIRIFCETEILTISDINAFPELTGEDTTITIKAAVSRKQVVEAFYFGLLNFAKSEKFKSIEWEIQYKEGTNEILDIGYSGTRMSEFRSQIIEHNLFS